MSQTLLSLAGFQVLFIGRFWVIAEANPLHISTTFCTRDRCEVSPLLGVVSKTLLQCTYDTADCHGLPSHQCARFGGREPPRWMRFLSMPLLFFAVVLSVLYQTCLADVLKFDPRIVTAIRTCCFFGV
jgi:hypothetical protein